MISKIIDNNKESLGLELLTINPSNIPDSIENSIAYGLIEKNLLKNDNFNDLYSNALIIPNISKNKKIIEDILDAGLPLMRNHINIESSNYFNPKIDLCNTTPEKDINFMDFLLFNNKDEFLKNDLKNLYETSKTFKEFSLLNIFFKNIFFPNQYLYTKPYGFINKDIAYHDIFIVPLIELDILNIINFNSEKVSLNFFSLFERYANFSGRLYIDNPKKEKFGIDILRFNSPKIFKLLTFLQMNYYDNVTFNRKVLGDNEYSQLDKLIIRGGTQNINLLDLSNYQITETGLKNVEIFDTFLNIKLPEVDTIDLKISLVNTKLKELVDHHIRNLSPQAFIKTVKPLRIASSNYQVDANEQNIFNTLLYKNDKQYITELNNSHINIPTMNFIVKKENNSDEAFNNYHVLDYSEFNNSIELDLDSTINIDYFKFLLYYLNKSSYSSNKTKAENLEIFYKNTDILLNIIDFGIDYYNNNFENTVIENYDLYGIKLFQTTPQVLSNPFKLLSIENIDNDIMRLFLYFDRLTKNFLYSSKIQNRTMDISNRISAPYKNFGNLEIFDNIDIFYSDNFKKNNTFISYLDNVILNKISSKDYVEYAIQKQDNKFSKINYNTFTVESLAGWCTLSDPFYIGMFNYPEYIPTFLIDTGKNFNKKKTFLKKEISKAEIDDVLITIEKISFTYENLIEIFDPKSFFNNNPNIEKLLKTYTNFNNNIIQQLQKKIIKRNTIKILDSKTFEVDKKELNTSVIIKYRELTTESLDTYLSHFGFLGMSDSINSIFKDFLIKAKFQYFTDIEIQKNNESYELLYIISNIENEVDIDQDKKSVSNTKEELKILYASLLELEKKFEKPIKLLFINTKMEKRISKIASPLLLELKKIKTPIKEKYSNYFSYKTGSIHPIYDKFYWLFYYSTAINIPDEHISKDMLDNKISKNYKELKYSNIVIDFKLIVNIAKEKIDDITFINNYFTPEEINQLKETSAIISKILDFDNIKKIILNEKEYIGYPSHIYNLITDEERVPNYINYDIFEKKEILHNTAIKSLFRFSDDEKSNLLYFFEKNAPRLNKYLFDHNNILDYRENIKYSIDAILENNAYFYPGNIYLNVLNLRLTYFDIHPFYDTDETYFDLFKLIVNQNTYKSKFINTLSFILSFSDKLNYTQEEFLLLEDLDNKLKEQKLKKENS